MTPSAPISRRAGLLVLFLSSAALAQLPSRPQPKTEPVPPDIALHDLRAAYAKTVAEEMTVRFRAPGGPERVDDLIIRLEGSTEGVRSMLLEMGALRIHAAAGKLTAISTTVSGKYVERAYKEPLTPASLAALMPPVPLPQLALAANAPTARTGRQRLPRPHALYQERRLDRGRDRRNRPSSDRHPHRRRPALPAHPHRRR